MGIFDFLKRRKRDPRTELKELLEGYELPSFPSSTMKVLEMLREPDSSLSDISRHIEADPGMHVSVLRTVNSAAYGLSRKVGNVQHAITLLGRSRLESIILPIAVKNSVPPIDFPCLNQKTFWQTSARRACLARALAMRIHPATQMESFTAGLLQDMAIPVLVHVKERDYCSTLELWNLNLDIHLDELERKTFGFDHQSIGALMAENWEFPDYLLDAILHHHRENGDIPLAKAVRIVSYIRYSSETREEDTDSFIIDVLKRELEIRERLAWEILKQARAEAEEFATIFA